MDLCIYLHANIVVPCPDVGLAIKTTMKQHIELTQAGGIHSMTMQAMNTK